jgi:hypothetical protein
MIGAIVVLLAGALGGIPSLPDLTGEWVAYFTSITPEHPTPPTNDNTHMASAPPAPTPAASKPPPTPTTPDDQASQRPTPDTLRRQAAELQGQIAQRSQELASLNSSESQARHQLDALYQQRQSEQATISQLQAQQKQMAAAVPQPAPPPSGNPPVQAASVPPRAITQYPRRQAQPASAPRRTASYPDLTQTPRDDLENASNLLVSGRPADARQLLVSAQAQSALRPVTPDQPYATGGSLTATRISDAIRFLDRGNTRYALQEINMAMDGRTTEAPTWPAYPSATSQGGHYPPQPVYR